MRSPQRWIILCKWAPFRTLHSPDLWVSVSCKKIDNGTLLYGYYVSFLKEIELKMVLNVWGKKKRKEKDLWKSTNQWCFHFFDAFCFQNRVVSFPVAHPQLAAFWKACFLIHVRRTYLISNHIAEFCMKEARRVCHRCVLEGMWLLTIFTLSSHTKKMSRISKLPCQMRGFFPIPVV